MKENITDYLFKTNAIQTCPEEEPFFYTSGKIGPYYINTHFLCGGKNRAQKLLDNMEDYKKDILLFPKLVFNDLNKCFKEDEIYKNVIGMVVKKLQEMEFDFISGGERRDFFFSMIPAFLLKKPHISILKDKTVIISDSNFENSKLIDNNYLKDKKIVHIADLVTLASSYLRAWIPAIESYGGVIDKTISIVDRNQGGKEILKEQGIDLFSFAAIDKDTFIQAKEKKFINEKQYNMIIEFTLNPDKFMENFFNENPGFLQNQIDMGGKNKQRALLCIENNYHKG